MSRKLLRTLGQFLSPPGEGGVANGGGVLVQMMQLRCKNWLKQYCHQPGAGMSVLVVETGCQREDHQV